MLAANDIYESVSDMDFCDYIETREQELQYIQDMLDVYGARAALDKVMEIFKR